MNMGGGGGMDAAPLGAESKALGGGGAMDAGAGVVAFAGDGSGTFNVLASSGGRSPSLTLMSVSMSSPRSFPYFSKKSFRDMLRICVGDGKVWGRVMSLVSGGMNDDCDESRCATNCVVRCVWRVGRGRRERTFLGILTMSFLSCLRISTAKSSALFMMFPHCLSTAKRVGGT